MSDLIDEFTVRKFLELLHSRAAAALSHIRRPGVLQLVSIAPGDRGMSISPFNIGDIDSMVEAALTDARAGRNVYVEARSVRPGLPHERGRGKLESTIAVFAFVVDSDADTGKAGYINGNASAIVETSPPNNTHTWLFLRRGLDAGDAKPLGMMIRKATGADHDTGVITQPYRIAGTPNYPTSKKRARGRVAVPTRLISVTDKLWTLDELTAIFSTAQTQPAKTQPPRKVAGSLKHNGPGHCIPHAVKRRIAAKVTAEMDRSAQLHSAVHAAARAGMNPDHLETLMREHPDGCASKYLESGDRLRAEIDRSWEKAEQNNHAESVSNVEPKPQPGPQHPPCAIEETLAVYKQWLILPNLMPVYAVLGTVAANLLPGDPVWLGIIGPPSSAKTEILNSTSLLPHVVQAATLSIAGLLSGTPKKQYDKGAKGGLLRQISDFGIITLKDFGSILSMRPDAKAELLAALREIYDGSWTRHLGTDGGRTLAWRGKVGLLFGATSVIDTHYGVIGAMGDRFLLSRLAPVPRGQFGQALKHMGAATAQMRKELAEAVARLFVGRQLEPRSISEDEIERIDRIIMLVVRLRGAVERDRSSREIEAVYGAEGTARIGLTLERLLAGLDTLGVDRELALDVVEAVAMDSVPPIRRRAYGFLASASDGGVETTDVANALSLPTVTVRRALEDLAAYDLAVRTSQGQGKADVWRATD
jgi:hypothetical protein